MAKGQCDGSGKGNGCCNDKKKKGQKRKNCCKDKCKK